MGTFKPEFFRGAVHFSEQRCVKSEQQNPVFRQNRFSGSNFVTNAFFDLQKSLSDAEFCGDSKSGLKSVVSHRNLEKIVKNREFFSLLL